ncbi:F-box domain-containing protein [Mycena chlorophos]|uniref:F-box domain-containing protein n=1 Tax=Mycena chlorophos TaxID=658473 RepID=A0A8H6RYC7_MYCCL|nr:F-box domain-containing protein [Mycena chlorophos]
MGRQYLITEYFRPLTNESKPRALPRPTFTNIKDIVFALHPVDENLFDTFFSNSEASEDEKALCRSQLDLVVPHSTAVADEMRRLELSISSLEYDLQRWEKLHDKLEESIQLYRCMSAPIRSLPDELLGEIFAQCGRDERDNFSSLCTLESIALVCGRWRRVALANRTLWRYIHDHQAYRPSDIDADEEPEYLPTRSVIQRAKMHLKHAGDSVPLSITLSQTFDKNLSGFVASDPEQLREFQMTSSFINELFLTSFRWDALSLEYNIDELAAFTQRALQRGAAMPNVVNVSLLVDERRYRPQPMTALRLPVTCSRLLHSLPALEVLTITLRGLFSLGFPSFAPWGQLRFCKFAWCNDEDVLAALPLFTAKTSVHVLGAWRSASSIGSLAAPVRSMIRGLKVDEYNVSEKFIATLLKNLVSPNLTSLRLTAPDGLSTALWPTISELTKRSSCRLKHLSVAVPGLQMEKQLAPLLAFFRSQGGAELVELSIIPARTHTPDFIDALAQQEDLLVQLRTLELYYWHRGPHKLDEKALIALHQKRPALRELRLISDSPAFSGFSPATIRSLHEGGLEVVVEYARWRSEEEDSEEEDGEDE